MLNMRVGSLALVLITTAAAGLYGCGSDDDTVASGGSGGGGASGAAGKGGGGSAGKAGGGSAGKGGSGTAGGAEAGTAGSTGTVGDEGGMGGAVPTVGGASGAGEGGAVGEGGEAGGGSVPLTLAQACAITCGDQTGLSCTFGADCVNTCTVNESMSPAPPEEYDAMIECEAQHLKATNYECSDQGGGLVWPAPKDGTSCESEICKWTCDDGGILADVNIFGRCGC